MSAAPNLPLEPEAREALIDSPEELREAASMAQSLAEQELMVSTPASPARAPQAEPASSSVKPAAASSKTPSSASAAPSVSTGAAPSALATGVAPAVAPPKPRTPQELARRGMDEKAEVQENPKPRWFPKFKF
ncbi:Uncharacterised protein [uncultured archaeon]|nr:Uncharacterised protein [uncultured archaeon]